MVHHNVPENRAGGLVELRHGRSQDGFSDVGEFVVGNVFTADEGHLDGVPFVFGHHRQCRGAVALGVIGGIPLPQQPSTRFGLDGFGGKGLFQLGPVGFGVIGQHHGDVVAIGRDFFDGALMYRKVVSGLC